MNILSARSAKHRTVALVTVLFAAGVLLSAPCRVFAAAAPPAPHECCGDHCTHGDQDKSQGCETVCAAKSAKVLISHGLSVEPLLVAGPAAASGQEQNGGAPIGSSVDPAMTDSSPPLYVKHAALLI